jgi:hypothetical protein
MDRSTQEYLDQLERDYPWDGPRRSPTGSMQEKHEDDAQWERDDDPPEPEDDDDGR